MWPSLELLLVSLSEPLSLELYTTGMQSLLWASIWKVLALEQIQSLCILSVGWYDVVKLFCNKALINVWRILLVWFMQGTIWCQEEIPLLQQNLEVKLKTSWLLQWILLKVVATGATSSRTPVSGTTVVSFCTLNRWCFYCRYQNGCVRFIWGRHWSCMWRLLLFGSAAEATEFRIIIKLLPLEPPHLEPHLKLLRLGSLYRWDHHWCWCHCWTTEPVASSNEVASWVAGKSKIKESQSMDCAAHYCCCQ